jgi:hypothetical protein
VILLAPRDKSPREWEDGNTCCPARSWAGNQERPLEGSSSGQWENSAHTGLSTGVGAMPALRGPSGPREECLAVPTFDRRLLNAV